ncbi:hypothetical protein NPIL_108821 [Nephila pilipes]|uniref:Uncharacterized protein n=1 Tax=Nephila pilipes TaxID=299642 RepID=A0A8X6QB92_NEPPI|nr:hypothetical protein NPIL_108821 [Nephila pilipes]
MKSPLRIPNGARPPLHNISESLMLSLTPLQCFRKRCLINKNARCGCTRSYIPLIIQPHSFRPMNEILTDLESQTQVHEPRRKFQVKKCKLNKGPRDTLPPHIPSTLTSCSNVPQWTHPVL